MNPPSIQNPPLNLAPNLNQGSTVATILVEPRAQAVDVVVVIRAGVTTKEDGPCPQVQITGKKNTAFDIVIEKETFFQAKHEIRRNPGKFLFVEMSSTFDPFVDAGPS